MGTLEIFRTIMEAAGCLLLFFIGYVLNDLRQRVIRIEDRIFFDNPEILRRGFRSEPRERVR